MNLLLSAVLAATLHLIPQPAVVVPQKGVCRHPDAVSVRYSPALQAEAYILDVSRKGIAITAGSEAGAFYARQTLAQLDGTAGKPLTGLPGDPSAAARIPCVHIEDAPAFDYRAMMLDCSRHFWTVEEIKRVLDLLSAHKINTFHWHLTDDQGWRIEIKKYPELTTVGNYRPYTMSWPGHIPDGWIPDGIPVDGFYTQDQAREIIAYAAERHITVIPEIEIPGHSQAALATYPWLGCRGEGYEVACKWMISKLVYCPGKESTFEFLQGVLDEIIDLFPAPYIHIGGDECKKDEWKACPNCQQRIAAEGLADEKALQSYTIRRIEQYVRAKGKRIIGWDEIAEGGLSKTAVVMSRFGPASVGKCIDNGNKVILCQGKYCYFDYYQWPDHSKEPRAHSGGDGNLNVEVAYSFDPKSLYSRAQMENVMGVECCLWTEYVPEFGHLQYMLVPRIDAFSEVAWSLAPKDFPAFRERLQTQARRYDAAGIRYARHYID